MAGAKVPAPLDPMVNGDDWTNILARYNRTVKGAEGVSLTNWAAGNTDRPEIAAGSVIEIDGAPFEYATDDTIADEAGLTDGWCYIKHVVSGDAVTPTLTNTFGTWDTAKQGFYDGSGNRFSLFAMYRSGAITKIFTEKAIIPIEEARLGYRFYEKYYSGTIAYDGVLLYLLTLSDVFFNFSEYYSHYPCMVNLSASAVYYDIKNVSIANNTAGGIKIAAGFDAGYNGKTARIIIKYKLSL